MVALTVNGKAQSIDTSPDMPLLWVLREKLLLTGTKYGCGMAICGACTVHVDGQPLRSCTTPVSAVAGRAITAPPWTAAESRKPGGTEWWARGFSFRRAGRPRVSPVQLP